VMPVDGRHVGLRGHPRIPGGQCLGRTQKRRPRAPFRQCGWGTGSVGNHLGVVELTDHPAVAGATLVGAVVGDGTALAIAHGADAGRVDAVILHDALLDSGGTAGGEILVVGIGAHRVGVAFEHQVDVVVGLHGVGHGGQFIAVDVAYHGLVELELHVEAHGDGAG